MHALNATDVRRLYTTKAGDEVGVRGVSLSLEPGETTAILGPNGCGKSTLLGMLATIDPPDAGSVTISGIRITRDASSADRRAARAHLGVVFQTHILDPLLTVRENLLAAAALHASRTPNDRIDELLASLRIADRVNDRVGKLSGGLARRADLARALLHRPSVLLLDEPTTGLDPEARADLLATLADLRAQPTAPAILLTTHLTEEAQQTERVLIMNDGLIAAQGSPDELRATLGDRTLTVEHEPAQREPVSAHLVSLGLSITASDDSGTTASFDAADPKTVTAALLESNTRFRVGPPSLADVYAATVGTRALAASTGATP